MKVTLNKIEAAVRQIETAIELLFRNRDPVSAHTLAMAGFSILKDMAEHRKLTSILDLGMSQFNEEKVPELWKLARAPSNFFKHADRDPEASLTFSTELTPGILFLSVSLLQDLGYQPTPHTKSYFSWFVLIHPQFLLEGDLKDHVMLTRAIGDLGGVPMDREEQFSFGLMFLKNMGVEI